MGILIFLFVALLVIALLNYNALQLLAQEVREKNSNIGVSSAKQASLINQLTLLVKEYQVNEQFTLLKISEDANTSAITTSFEESKTILTSIRSIADRYPELKSNQQYNRLMDASAQCEHEILAKRELYNQAVKIYNQKRLSIPTVFVARFMGFSNAPYLDFKTTSSIDMTNLKSFDSRGEERLNQLLSNAGSNIAGAAKSVANTATQASKILADKVKDKKEPTYFYLIPGSVPKGPILLSDIKSLVNKGTIPENVQIAATGSEEWKDINSITDQFTQRLAEP